LGDETPSTMDSNKLFFYLAIQLWLLHKTANPTPFMEKENKDRLLDAPEIYERLRETIFMLQMNNTELGEKFNISRTYIQKILSGNAAISGSAIKAFIAGGLDIQYIFTGQSDREEIKKLNAEIRTLKDLIREAYSGER
jgi:hypothetical protein